MANNNRNEAAAAIEALAATVDLEELKEALNDFFAQSCVFRKDVSSTDAAAGSSKTVVFTDIDYIAVTQTAVFTNYTLSGVQQGEIKYMKVTKTSGYNILFTGVVDTTFNNVAVLEATEVLYRITNKDGTSIIVEPLIDAGNETTDWQTPSYNANFSAGTDPLQYRLANSRLEFRGEMDVVGTAGAAFTLPVAYRPATDTFLAFSTVGASTAIQPFIIRDTGVIEGSDWLDSGTGTNYFNNIIIID